MLSMWTDQCTCDLPGFTLFSPYDDTIVVVVIVVGFVVASPHLLFVLF